MDDLNPAGIGHNSQLPYDTEVVEKLQTRIRELDDAGKAWAELEMIENEEQAGKLNDFLTQARTTIKEVEDTRKKEKQPHLDAGSAVDTKFNALKKFVSDMGTKLKTELLDPYATEKQRKIDTQKKIEQEAAEKKAAEAERLRKAAEESDDAILKAEAEAAEKAAAKASKAAAKPARAQIASGTGGGRTMALRTYYTASIKSKNLAFSFFRDHPEYEERIEALLVQMAESEHRKQDGAKEIPGIIFTAEQRTA